METVSHALRIFGHDKKYVESILHRKMHKDDRALLSLCDDDGETEVKISTSKAQFRSIKSLLAHCFGGSLYGIDVPNLQTALVKALTARSMYLATAESCTGGLISAKITDVPGASNVFECGICSYAASVKHQLLGVSELTLVQEGVVSAKTAKEMAEGVRALAGATIGVSSTGLAGPGGGTVAIPVGTVYIGIADLTSTRVYPLHITQAVADQRAHIRNTATKYALFCALMCVTKGELS